MMETFGLLVAVTSALILIWQLIDRMKKLEERIVKLEAKTNEE